jgi:excinuclease ABC subunit C
MDGFRYIKDKNFNELPKTSGVYCFKEKNETIYIGKAINIQSRVKNHFQQPSYRDNLFMNKVDKIGYLETNSEIEALVLEANLIKKHQPKFNVIWKDDKNYFYVAINRENIPYIFITHQPFGKTQGKQNYQKTEYIGPFVEGTALKKTLRFLRKVFPYYTVKKHSKVKCTYCHLGLCPGPTPDLKEYKKNINKLILILEGKTTASGGVPLTAGETVLNSLKKEMKLLSDENKFEEAGKIRDRISNLQQVMAHTNVISQSKTEKPTANSSILNKIIGIDKEIHRIECYDISNIQGKFATGSMVSAQGGPASGWVLNRNQYRRFRIKIENEPNDIAMLKETLQRRFAHPEWKYPEVILIDGGIAQLNIAINTKNENPKTKGIKVISIAKKNKDLYIEGKNSPILLKLLPREIYNLVLQLDDEAHRFAITYHKKLRSNNLLK